MLKHLLLSIALMFLGNQYLVACSCVPPTSFCESINNFDGQIGADIILRAKVVESMANGKDIKVSQILLGELNETKIIITPGFCDLNFIDLKDDKEYIIALTEHQGIFNLVGCTISFLIIENEVIKGKIAPGIDRLDYDELFELESCGVAFSQLAISKNLQLFPNPTSDVLQIHNTGEEFAYENLNLTIYDVIGKKIGEHKYAGALLPDDAWSINIENFASGVYVIQVSNAVRKVSYKLVKV